MFLRPDISDHQAQQWRVDGLPAMAMCLPDLVPEGHDLAGGPNFLFKSYIGMLEAIGWGPKGQPLSQQAGSTRLDGCRTQKKSCVSLTSVLSSANGACLSSYAR